LLQGNNTEATSAGPIDAHEIDFSIGKAASGKEWPQYKRQDISNRDGSDGKKIWVTYKNGVFDITDFIDNHPGGNKILLVSDNHGYIAQIIFTALVAHQMLRITASNVGY
jgi:hypothetical protein